MNSKKLFSGALMIAFLTIVSTANAQLRLGLKGEVGINKPLFTKDLYSVENMNAFKVGPSVEFMFSEQNLGIETSLLYSNEKMTVKNVESNGITNVLDKVSSHYVDIPVNLKYKIAIISPLKIYLAAGPYAQLKVAGDEFTYDAFKNQVKNEKFQAGVNLGAGAELLSKIQVGFNYRMRLTDDYSSTQPQWEDILNENKGFWSLSAALYF